MAYDNEQTEYLKPKADIYLALLAVTTAATGIACLILFVEIGLFSK